MIEILEISKYKKLQNLLCHIKYKILTHNQIECILFGII